MRPWERRETGEQDLFRSRLDQIIDMKHALVKLARAIERRFLEREFGAVYTDGPGSPPLPTRLMAGLAILKHTYDVSDEVLCERWIENPYTNSSRRGVLPARPRLRSLVADGPDVVLFGLDREAALGRLGMAIYCKRCALAAVT
jgi:hypothetical protein